MMHAADSCPTLRPLAMKILAQCASNSSFEHNWSTYKYVHSTIRNFLLVDRANKLVYMYSNENILNVLESDDYEEGIPIQMHNCTESNDEITRKDQDGQSTVNDDALLLTNADMDINVDDATEVKIAQNQKIDDVVIDQAMLDIMTSTIVEDEADDNNEEV